MELLTCGRHSATDYYEVLGITSNASTKEIRRAYHRLAFQCHPDRHQASEEAHKKMQEINEAYAILSDPIKRREYDVPRGYGIKVPKFKRGSKVKIGVNSYSQYRGYTGFVDKEPMKDTFRFWYMVKIVFKDFTTVNRFAEEELEKLGD